MKKEPFHFVLNQAGSEKERKRQRQLARSHTARINREKRQGQSSSHEKDTSEIGQPVTASSSQDALLSERLDSVSVSSSDRDDASGGEVIQFGELVNSVISPAHNTWTGWEQTEESAEEASAVTLPPRTLAPTLGAPTTQTFRLAGSALETARAADYCINVIWPNLLMDKAASAAWFAAFREQAIVFHGFQYALAVHHDILSNQVAWSTSRSALVHKTKTIRLLNGMLSNLKEENLDVAIMAVLVLASNELQPEKMVSESVLLFDPHMPGANWNSVYARMEQVEEHGRAMVTLIQRRGGLDKIQLPGLGGVLAFSDILSASYALTQPVFPCFWTEDISDAVWPRGHLYLSRGSIAEAGRGFMERVPHELPQQAQAALKNLSVVDRAMDECRERRLKDSELRVAVGIRNRAQHRLLSLPTWNDLTVDERAKSSQAEYDCCRLTSILYSNAVVFPLPPHSGWHLKLLEAIQALLTPSVLEDWSKHASTLLLWTLVICGNASFRTAHRPFFEKALRRTLLARDYLLPKAAVRTAVKEFLWTDSACGRGFMELWDALDLGKVGELDVR